VGADWLASGTVTGMASAQQPRHFWLPGSIAADCLCAFRRGLPWLLCQVSDGAARGTFPALTAHHGNERTWTGMSTGAKAGP
jgi:hypothetical protein